MQLPSAKSQLFNPKLAEKKHFSKPYKVESLSRLVAAATSRPQQSMRRSPHAAVVSGAPTRVTRVLLHAMRFDARRLREELQEEIKLSAWRTLLHAKEWTQGAGCCVWRMKRGES
jgi:hypothetical protein